MFPYVTSVTQRNGKSRYMKHTGLSNWTLFQTPYKFVVDEKWWIADCWIVLRINHNPRHHSKASPGQSTALRRVLTIYSIVKSLSTSQESEFSTLSDSLLAEVRNNFRIGGWCLFCLYTKRASNPYTLSVHLVICSVKILFVASSESRLTKALSEWSSYYCHLSRVSRLVLCWTNRVTSRR